MMSKKKSKIAKKLKNMLKEDDKKQKLKSKKIDDKFLDLF